MATGFYPKAVIKNISPGPTDPPIKPRVAILHVDAGNADSLYGLFNGRSGGVESHFHVKRNGVIEQYRSIYYEADANYKANPFAVSIETQGYGDGDWTSEQIKSIKDLLLWLNDEAGIPLRKIARWNGSGVGYHIQFGTPGWWTPVAKSCPGPKRIRQFNKALVPWMRRMRNQDKPTRVSMARAKVAEALVILKDVPKERKAAKAYERELRELQKGPYPKR